MLTANAGQRLTAIRNAVAVDAKGPRAGVEIMLENGRIRAVLPESRRPVAISELDAAGAAVIPGFVDMHVHGALGSDFRLDRSDDAAKTISRYHLQHGTTSMLASIPALPLDQLTDAILAVRPLVEAPGSSIVGIHLEGPFLSPEYRGAHPAEFIRTPTVTEVEALLTAAQGTIRLLAFAPEIEGASLLYEIARHNRIVLAVGHTSASYAQARRGFELGARQLTHTMNAMPQPDRRAPGPVAAAIEDDRVVLEVVLDGLHVQEPVVRMLYRAIGPERLAVVTDATSLAGLDPSNGMHHFSGMNLAFEGGLPRVPGTGTIAGSVLTMDAALRNVMSFTGVDLPTAIQMTSATPARSIGIGDRKGRIAPGFDADLVLLDSLLAVQRVVLGGFVVQ